jgi:rRNA maturation endonuclease Nob1
MSGDAAKQDETSIKRVLNSSSIARPVRYGLPCANCKAYYSAEFDVCAICSCAERVSANGSAQQAAPFSPAGIL